MMIPPDSVDDDYPPYDEARGKCPRCGSGSVRHLVIGMPAGPVSAAGSPDWVEWVGCVHPGHDRECDRCGLAWVDQRRAEPSIQ